MSFKKEATEFVLIPGTTEFTSQVTFQELPEQAVDQSRGNVTPSVLNKTRLIFLNPDVVIVTNILDAQEGQVIYLLGDGFTTIANNANIKTRTAANRLLANGLVYVFVYMNAQWRETA